MKNKSEYLESENARLRALLQQAGIDAAASGVTQNLQRLLLTEMHHRIKNMLAMVQSIVTQSLRTVQTPAEASEAIALRIGALARTHDILLSTAGEESPLRSLLEDITAPFGGNRFQISLPTVDISAKAAVALALVINELATNAVKYGSLSSPSGAVTIVGRTDAAANELVVTWIESGGPAVQGPTKESFGTQLIRVALPSEPVLEFRPTGVFCEMRVPLPLDDGQISN